jgi:hypothetical protein
MLRQLSSLDTGFSAFQLADPVIVADISGNGVFNTADRTLLLREISAIDQTLIPPIPPGVAPIVLGGPDPYVSLPQTMSAQPGGVVTLPVSLDTAVGLESAQMRVAYDASALEVIDVRRGSLTSEFEYLIRRDEPGILHIDMAALRALQAGTGSLVEVDLRIKPQAAAGLQLIDLQWTSLNDGGLTLNPAPQPGADQTDGSIRVQAPVAPQVTTRKAAASALPALALEQQAAASRVPAATGSGQTPVVDWTASVKPVFATPARIGSDAGVGWKGEFVSNLARSDEDSNPNRKIKVTLPATSKVGPAISALKERS